MLWSALIFGLLGSFHCVGMCGPIAFMLPVDRSNSTNKIFQIFTYHFGRLLAYALIGLFFGLVGKSLYIFGLQQQLSIFIGILMIIAVILDIASPIIILYVFVTLFPFKTNKVDVIVENENNSSINSNEF